MLRFFEPDGRLVPTLAENVALECERAERERETAKRERERAQRLAERLRALGIDPGEV